MPTHRPKNQVESNSNEAKYQRYIHKLQFNNKHIYTCTRTYIYMYVQELC